MGRKTFESIGGGKALPGRVSIIITRNRFYKNESCKIANSIEEALAIAENDDEVFIIGGREIYQQSIDKCDRMYITRVHHIFQGDVSFPEFDNNEWILLTSQYNEADDKNIYSYTFEVYDRKKCQ